MIKIENKSACSGCHACYSACPQRCITMTEDQEGFLYPVVQETLCIQCNLCEQVCPIIQKKQGNNHPRIYAAINPKEEIRWKSSSGGIFSLIAEHILDQGGVVFGATFADDFSVEHCMIETKEQLSCLRGSKYVQSKIGDCFQETKKQLDGGRQVYFTGTPCQIEGLLTYLRKDYDNLLTQDIICHGVPSPKVWKTYISYQCDKYNSGLNAVSFRKKKEGIEQYFVSLTFQNGNVYEVPNSSDAYMKAFLNDFCLRPSCYSCQFKSKQRLSDITLADYWGIDSVHAGFNDKKGISLVWLNSEKGKKIFDVLKSEIIFLESNMDDAIRYNSSAVQSAPFPSKRTRFMNEVNENNFSKIVEKYSKPKIIKRIKRKIKQFLKW